MSKKRAYEKKYHYLYKTICKVNDKYYYGMHSTDNLDDGYLGSGQRLWHSINKHGKENHVCEKLEFFETRKKLRIAESKLVDKTKLKDPMCMNLMLGGEGGFNTLEGARKGGQVAGKIIGERMKDPNYNKEIKQKFNKAGQEWWKGKHHREESKKKISLSNKGKHESDKNSQFGTCWITNEKESKKIHRGDLIPDGWRLGRKMKK